jgi:type I phosphodiesterase/nucleotide pyrophosphatase
MRRLLASATLVVLLLWGGLGLAQARQGHTAPPDTVAREEPALPILHPGERHLLLLMIDGLAVSSFETALAAHELPNLERLFAARPTLRTQALSTFPSATAPSVPELLSGRWAEQEDLPAPNAVHAFDREQRRIVRYLTEPDTWSWPVPNLFDAAARAGLPAVTVFEGRWSAAGSILTTGSIARSAALEIIGASEFYGGDTRPVEALVSRIDKQGTPRVALVVFNEVDLKGHFHGPASNEVRRALISTDALIGEIVGALARQKTASGRSVFDETAILLFGDHGMTTSDRFLDLAEHFRQRGLVAYDASTATHVVLRERFGARWTRWPDVILVSGGSNITQLYLRSPSGGWTDGQGAIPKEVVRARRRPAVEELARQLVDVPGINQVLRLVAPREVEIRAAGGRIAWVIERGEGRDRRWAYAVPEAAQTDPLGYLTDRNVAPLVSRSGELSDAGFFDVDTWIERTRSARYPAAVPLIPKAFHPQRFTGDLILTALPGWSFIRNQHGDHGNLEREVMFTPLLLNGPGIAADATLPDARLVDIYPTAAALLGADPADPALAGLDGQVLPGVQPP